MKAIHNRSKEEFTGPTFWKYNGRDGLLLTDHNKRVLFVYSDTNGVDYFNITPDFTIVEDEPIPGLF